MNATKNPESGQVSLMDLFSCIVFFMPASAATTELQRSGGGALRYLVAVASALALGAVIVWLDWNLGKTVWLRSRQYSSRAQNAVAVALVAAELLWIVIGATSGFKLAEFVAVHVPR
jgi:hypothetical protein